MPKSLSDRALEAVYPFCPQCLRYLRRPKETDQNTATKAHWIACRCGWQGWARYYRWSPFIE